MLLEQLSNRLPPKVGSQDKGRFTPVVCVCLLAFTSCSDGRKTPHLAGHYYMLTREGKVEVQMTDAHKMRETVTPYWGAPRALEGAWTIEGDHVAFSPFLELAPQGIQFRTIWRARAKYDLNGDLQVLAYEDRSLYFQREYPALLTSAPHQNAGWEKLLVSSICGSNEMV